MITIYTDGSCPPTTKIGGWSFVVVKEGKQERVDMGTEFPTTNNRMELFGVLKAMEYLQELDSSSAPFTIYSDSKYVVNGINEWLKKWKANGWKTNLGEVKNKDLWVRIDELVVNIQNVHVQWVKGHSTSEFNNVADKKAVEAMKSHKLTNS